MHIPVISNNGLSAMHSLAASQPELFIDARQPELKSQLEQTVHNDPDLNEPYQGQIELLLPLDELNNVTLQGPSSDAHLAPILIKSLGPLSPNQYTDQLFWASINCFGLHQYTAKFIDRHWLDYGTNTPSRLYNSAARLWWLYERAERAAPYSTHSREGILHAMADHVNLYHQAFSRPYITSNSRLIAAIYDAFLDGGEYLETTANATQMLKVLNLRGATVSFDFLTYDQLRQAVEDAKPRNGR